MYQVLIAGGGNIGSLMATLLEAAGDYNIHLIDRDITGPGLVRIKSLKNKIQISQIDTGDERAFGQFVADKKFDAVISCLPYFCNVDVVKIAREFNLHYFDLTEDVSVTQAVTKLSESANTAFVPQCGLAPGFINIVANGLMQHFDELDTVKLRVGALPVNTSNALQYSLTWSTDGLINEYANPCEAVLNNKQVLVPALEGLEHLQIDGLEYEAFNTSGGLGNLAHSYYGRVKNLTYKTIRYPGHCEKMHFLMHELQLEADRENLKAILEHALPRTYQDVVLIYVSVTGIQNGQFMEENYCRKVYPENINGLPWSALQITSASGVCTVMDMVLNNASAYQGKISQEQFAFKEFLKNRFAKCYTD